MKKCIYLFIWFFFSNCADSNLLGMLKNIALKCDATEKIFLQGCKLWSQTFWIVHDWKFQYSAFGLELLCLASLCLAQWKITFYLTCILIIAVWQGKSNTNIWKLNFLENSLIEALMFSFCFCLLLKKTEWEPKFQNYSSWWNMCQ